MACGTVALASIGLSVSEDNGDVTSTAFFLQLAIVLGLIGRALQQGGDTGKSFFGPAFDAVWYSIRYFFIEYFLRQAMVLRRRLFPQKVKVEHAKNRWRSVRAKMNLSNAAEKLGARARLVTLLAAAQNFAKRGRKMLRLGSANVSRFLSDPTPEDDAAAAAADAADEESVDKHPHLSRSSSLHLNDDDEDVAPAAWAVTISRILIRFSPIMLIIFLAIPIGFTIVAMGGGFELDTTMVWQHVDIPRGGRQLKASLHV
jgi:hypothetical protein